MTVRAKFHVTKIEDFGPNQNRWASLMAVYAQDTDENKDFTRMTPSGDIRILISPESKAFEFFKPGEDVYVDFTKVPVPVKEESVEDIQAN